MYAAPGSYIESSSGLKNAIPPLSVLSSIRKLNEDQISFLSAEQKSRLDLTKRVSTNAHRRSMEP